MGKTGGTTSRVQEILDRENLNKNDLAQALGFSTGAAVTNWFARGTVPTKSLKKIAEVFPKYTYEWLIGEDELCARDREYLKIDLYTAEYRDGGTNFEKSNDTPPMVRKQALPAGGEFFALKTQDNALAPELLPGDIVVFNKQDVTIVDGAMYVVWLNKRLFMRRIFRNINGITLKSDVKNIEDIQISDELLENGNCKIVGRIIWRGGSC